MSSSNGISSPPSIGFHSIKSWDDISEPSWDKAGRRYGPNWSVDENLEPMSTPGRTGALVWAIPPNSTFTYPELRPDLPVGKLLRSRPNLGICMSGGGMRAATCALGWYRGLHHLNLLQKARYISATSGATWTSLPLSCRSLLQKKELGTDIDLDDYLGKYEGKFNEHTVHEERSIIGKNLVKADVLDPKFCTTTPGFNAWSTAINKLFVEPFMRIRSDWNWEADFWKDTSNAYLWNTDETKHILDEKSLPFPIFTATGYDSRNNGEFFPVENTLLYSGIPVDPRKLNEKSDFGGGFVQGVALNAESLADEVPVPVGDNLFLKDFKNPCPVVKIAQLTSASSNFAASGDAALKIDLQNSFWRKLLYSISKIVTWDFRRTDLSGYLDPSKFHWWSPSTGGLPVEINLVDGGMYDDLGVLALLRRKCSTIIVCDASKSDVLDVKTPKQLSEEYYAVASLFGRGTAAGLPEQFVKRGYKDTFNERSQVFAHEELDSLMDEMRALRTQGKPLVVRKKLRVIPNPLAGVYDSYDVDMIFCFTGVVDEFCQPEESGGLLKWIFGGGKKDDFPNFSTLKTNYTSAEVCKLSSLSSYNIVEGLKNVGFDIEQVGSWTSISTETLMTHR